jgi:hypothetical protein
MIRKEVVGLLLKPFHAKCTDRSKLSKRHKVVGIADDWFTNEILSEFSYYGLLSFDFFVDWNTGELSSEFWIKRIIPENVTLTSTSNGYIQDLIYECDGENEVKLAARYLDGNLKYKLFRETNNWLKHPNNPHPILDVKINVNGEVESVDRITLDGLKNDIQNLSGGPVRIGDKGLIYGYTTLECHLSKTDAAWPGDVDLLIIDDEYNPKVVIEFKKHTKKEPIEDYMFKRYYPYPDGRKYDRLMIFKNHIEKIHDTSLPLIVIYYPTEEIIDEIIIEEIVGDPGSLETTKEIRLELPKNEIQLKNLIQVLIDNYEL